MNGRVIKILAAAGVIAGFAGVASAETLEERLAALEAKFEQQASAREEKLLKRIEELEGQVKTLAAKTARPVVATGDEAVLTRMSSLEEQVATLTEEQELNPLKDITLGGYGELHYNALSGSGGADNKREIDFHRFVLTVGKEFNDRVRFFSEFELEHALAGEGKGGGQGQWGGGQGRWGGGRQ